MEKSAKIAVCGAGLTGAYLYRLLTRAGYNDVTLFETGSAHRTKCGIKPCAWGALTGFEDLISAAGLDPARYILKEFNSIVLNDSKVKARIILIDKPGLLSDLLKGAAIKRSQPRASDFKRLVDATGFSRAYLPPPAQDLLAACIQYRVTGLENAVPAIDISNLGYAWSFPLPDSEYHVGAGSVGQSPQKMLEKLGWLTKASHKCACSAGIRLSGPQSCLPFVNPAADCQTPVWGVGEAIGCVSPLMGEGLIPGLASVRLLLANWEDPGAYRDAVLKEFAWMKDERQLVDRMLQGKKVSIFDAGTFSSSARRLKLDLDYGLAMKLLGTVNRTL